MKTLILLATLLLAVPVGAGEPLASPQHQRGELYQFTLDGSLKIDKASFDELLHDYPDAKLRVMLTNDPCLAQMKEAMRAIDPFIGNHNPFLSDEQFRTALRLWLEAKQACWQKP